MGSHPAGCGRAGVKLRSCSASRCNFGLRARSILIGFGANVYTVSEILGHAAVTTTTRYAHLQVEQQRDALARAFA